MEDGRCTYIRPSLGTVNENQGSINAIDQWTDQLD